MPDIRWNLLKNNRLKKTRGASFDDMLQGKLIAIKKHPRKLNQSIMLFQYRRYIWVVPCVTDKKGDIILKTLFPSRKYIRMFREGKL